MFWVLTTRGRNSGDRKPAPNPKLKRFRLVALCVTAILFSHGFIIRAYACNQGPADVSVYRPVLSQNGVIIRWTDYTGPNGIIPRAWNYLLHPQPENPVGVPRLTGGLPAYYAYSEVTHGNQIPIGIWPHNPASVVAGFVESAVAWRVDPDSHGDTAPLTEIAIPALNALLTNGLTPASAAYANMPYSSSNPGDLIYRNGWTINYADGLGDGPGVIQPDKGAFVGYTTMMLWRNLGRPPGSAYLVAAMNIADTLAANVRLDANDGIRSPWPFRVVAQTGQVACTIVNPAECAEYGSNQLSPLQLFDALLDDGVGTLAQQNSWTIARDKARDYLLDYQIPNHDWYTYFEDVPTNSPTQANVVPLETAKYLFTRRDAVRFDWLSKGEEALASAEALFGDQIWMGARTIKEQTLCPSEMGSHTARYGAAKAIHARALRDLGDASGADAAEEQARRSLAWASYVTYDTGRVGTGPMYQGTDGGDTTWFSDGYGDYIKHFLQAIDASPNLRSEGIYTVASSGTVSPNSTFTVIWTAPAGHPDSGWIAFSANASDCDYSLGWKWLDNTMDSPPTGTGTSGAVTFIAPGAEGTYYIKYIKQSLTLGSCQVMHSVSKTVEDGGIYSVSSSGTVTPNTDFTVNWTAPAGHPDSGWIAFSANASDCDYSLGWKWLDNSMDSPPTVTGVNGSVTFTAPNAPGTYYVKYVKQSLLESSCEIVDSVSMTVSNSYSVKILGLVSLNTTFPVNWTAPPGHPDSGWIAFSANDSDCDYSLGWKWLDDTTGPPPMMTAASGSVTFTAPNVSGTYYVKYVLQSLLESSCSVMHSAPAVVQ